jgi:SRSO17 transposase
LKFLSDFDYLFTNLTRCVCANALIYLKGLLLCHRRNCQMMAEELQEGNSQNLHHFITGSKWAPYSVMDAVTVSLADQLNKASGVAG